MSRVYLGYRLPIATESPGEIDPDDRPSVPPSNLNDYEEAQALIDALRFNPVLDGNRTHSAPGSPEARNR